MQKRPHSSALILVAFIFFASPGQAASVSELAFRALAQAPYGDHTIVLEASRLAMAAHSRGHKSVARQSLAQAMSLMDPYIRDGLDPLEQDPAENTPLTSFGTVLQTAFALGFEEEFSALADALLENTRSAGSKLKASQLLSALAALEDPSKASMAPHPLDLDCPS